MDKVTATEFVRRIEAHREQEEVIWQEMRSREDYEMHEDQTIASIISQRKAARELIAESEADLSAFDWVDDGSGNSVPREEEAA
jgi:Zn-dependent M32 family carboxypeptidase